MVFESFGCKIFLEIIILNYLFKRIYHTSNLSRCLGSELV